MMLRLRIGLIVLRIYCLGLGREWCLVVSLEAYSNSCP